MTRKMPEILSADELKELRRLKVILFELTERALLLALRLALAPDSSVRGMARDRLLCVIQDCLSPAVRDLNSIAREARRHANLSKRRRSHAARGSGRHPR